MFESINRTNKVKEYTDYIGNYNPGSTDFSIVDKGKRKIKDLIIGNKNIFYELSKKIDIDFVRESESIEDRNKDEITLNQFLNDSDVKILEALPIGFLDEKLFKLSKEDLSAAKKDLYKDVVLIARNNRTKEVREIPNSKHLFALNNIIDIARRDRYKLIKNKKAPLDHYLIMDTNRYLFEGTPMEMNPLIGSYRSEYSCGRISITEANWTPVESRDVSDHMDALLTWYNEKSENLHPIERAAILHTEFIRIHPFVDGNGRTARLLMNYELARHGYPTVVIKSRNKKEYIEALEKGVMTRDVQDFVTLITDAVLTSERKYIPIIANLKDKNNPIQDPQK